MTTVIVMKQTAAPNSQRGSPWSRIQPNSIGPTAPPTLKPVETMPKERPAAPGGAAARTSMSRAGATRTEKQPARAMTGTKEKAGRDEVATQRNHSPDTQK